MTKPTYTLVEKFETLCLPGEGEARMLLYFYPAGDCDRCEWPREAPRDDETVTWEQRLAGALFDAVETGDIPEHHGEFVVRLPDGTEFLYLDHVR